MRLKRRMQKLQQKQVMKKLQRLTKEAILHQVKRPNQRQVLQVPSQQKRRNQLKHQRQTINQLKLLRQQQNQLKSKLKIEKMSTISKVLLLRRATMRLVPTLLRIKLSMEMTILVGLQTKMYQNQLLN